MTALDQPCKDFGDIVQDVQQCTDPGKGLEQLTTKGVTALLAIRDTGYKVFDVTEKAKADAAKARDAFDEKTLVLQNLLYESGYYQKEIQEARDYKSAVSEVDMELVSTEEFMQAAGSEFTAGLDASSAEYNHQLMLKRLEHALQSRKQARQQLRELTARRDALQTNLGQKRKALTDLRKHASIINSSTQSIRSLFSLPHAAADQGQQELAQLLPLPLYFILSQATAILGTLSTLVTPEVVGSRDDAAAELAGGSKASAQPARKKQKRSASVGSASENDLYQAFPLSVKLHLSDLALIVTFTYLPALGIVTAEANHKAGNGLLASLFRADSGANTPNGANKYIGDGSFAFDAKATARPYRWAQWLAGLDFLPALPAGLLVQGNVSQETLQEAVASYTRERRAIHILTTLVQRAQDASHLGHQLLELDSKRIALQFPNRLFQHAPVASLHVWQEMPKHAWPASVAASKLSPVPAATKPDATTEDAEEGEEGELNDAPESSSDAVKAEEDEGAMDIDKSTADQETSGQAPVPMTQADEQGRIAWGKPGPDASFRLFKLMLKAPNGWQLDGYVQVYSSYPATAPQAVVTAIKESHNPARNVKAGKVPRPELPAQKVAAVQTQANQELLTKLNVDEQSHVLCYQLTQLLVSLIEQTKGKEITPLPSRLASRPLPTTASVPAPAAVPTSDANGTSSVTTRSGAKQR